MIYDALDIVLEFSERLIMVFVEIGFFDFIKIRISHNRVNCEFPDCHIYQDSDVNTSNKQDKSSSLAKNHSDYKTTHLQYPLGNKILINLTRRHSDTSPIITFNNYNFTFGPPTWDI